MGEIKIAITDDHKIFREGLKATLSVIEDFKIVMEADNGEELLERYSSCRPDIFLMDINMPKLDGIATTKKLLASYPEARVIALSVSNQEIYVAKMFEAGARGYLLKDADPEEIVKAIQMVMRGEFYFSDNLSMFLYKKLFHSQHPAFHGPIAEEAELTGTEIKVLELICKEHTNQEIASLLALSIKTVENCRNKLLSKTRSKNTTGLVIYAIRKGYVVI